MFTTLVISGCSIVYELLISAVSSYILGDSIMQFSITIGLYMFAMGIGSWLTKFIKSRLFNWLVSIEILIGILGGTSALVLFMSNLYLPGYHPVMYLEILLIGLLAGLEIPLLTRIVEEQAGDLRLTLSNVFSFDYIGALIGSIAFPLLLLPQFGYFSAAFVAGTLNLAMAIFIAFKYRQYIVRPQIFQIIAVAICSLMVVGILNGESLANKVEQGLYRDKIIHIEQTPYQKLVLTQHKKDIRLLMMDFDNTIVPYVTDNPSRKVLQWLEKMSEYEIQLCVVSNSKKDRVEIFCEKHGIDCITHAGKPGTKGIKACLYHYGIPEDFAALVGD
jgi:spermidine synthase